jgi:hypothetical protein
MRCRHRFSLLPALEQSEREMIRGQERAIKSFGQAGRHQGGSEALDRSRFTWRSGPSAAHLPGMNIETLGPPTPGLEPRPGIDEVADYLGVSVTTIYDCIPTS